MAFLMWLEPSPTTKKRLPPKPQLHSSHPDFPIQDILIQQDKVSEIRDSYLRKIE